MMFVDYIVLYVMKKALSANDIIELLFRIEIVLMYLMHKCMYMFLCCIWHQEIEFKLLGMFVCVSFP